MPFRTPPKPAPEVLGRPTIVDALRATLFGNGAIEWVSRGRRRGLQISLFGGGALIGLLSSLLERRLPDGVLDTTSWVLISLMILVVVAIYVIHDAAMGLELIEKRQTEADLQLARRIQLRMLPNELPRLKGYTIAVHHEAARSVGGDAFDVLPLDEDHVFLTVADVSGKGTAAALLTSGLLARTRALARTGMPIGELATRLSSAIDEETETHHFATVLLVLLELSTGVISYVNAGNQAPVVLRADGSRAVLSQGGIPVGMLPNVTYTTGRAFLGEGDRLVMTTDGVFDADDAGGTLLSEDEFLALVARHDDPREALATLAREVERRSPGGRFDDITVMVIGRESQSTGSSV